MYGSGQKISSVIIETVFFLTVLHLRLVDVKIEFIFLIRKYLSILP